MPQASSTRHQRSLSPALGSPLSQPPLTSADVAKKKIKKKSDDVARSDPDSTVKPDAKTLLDDSPEPSPMSHSPALSVPPAPTMVEPPSAADSPAFGPLDEYAPSPGEPDFAARTDTWARGVPFGKSPPNDPADGAGIAESPPAFALPPPPHEVSYSPASPPTSPPQTRLRPVSQAELTPLSSPSSFVPRDRQARYSISSHRSNNRLSYPPPPPSQIPQTHLYSAPDAEVLGAPNPEIMLPQQPGHSFCSIELLASSAHKTAKTGGNVILVGREGALDVLAVENSRTKVIGSIQGLTGRVIDAKVLTWSSSADPFLSLRPLVAITTHGLTPKDDISVASPSTPSVSDQMDLLTGTSPKQTGNVKPDIPSLAQTRVQIYSLKTRELISTLFATKPIPCVDAFPGVKPYIPPPTANLRTFASGNLVIIASGTSGEVLVFGVAPAPLPAVYQCITKVWTNVQAREIRRYSNSSVSTDADDPHLEAGRAYSKIIDVPILSVSGRWLAVVSPSPHRVSLHGATPPHVTLRKMYGVDSHNPPSRPSITCGVDSGEGESFLNKVARGVTQEMFKGARWIGDQGLQTWNNYWNKDSQTGPSQPLRRPQSMEQHAFAADLLPPTHAQDTQVPSSNEPDLVSIFDLKPLEDFQDGKSSNPNPVATFQPPHGCSFLSLSPNGLMLVTASKKGDIQCIWDLMQIRLCRARAFLAEDPFSTAKSNPPAAHVRQVARYARLTTSTIRDVIWTAPNGEHVAIITKKGTTHVYEVPPAAFRWPPLRRSLNSITTTNNDSYARDDAADEMPLNPFSAAVKLVGDTTQPFLAAMRGRAPSVGAFTVTKGFAIPSAGGKAVAAGLSKSVGAATETMNNLRYVGENRLHPSNFAKDSNGTKVVWIGDEQAKELSLGIMDGGAFKVYQVGKSSSSPKNRRLAQPFFGGKILEARLPPEIHSSYIHEQAITRGPDTVTGFWAGTSSHRPASSSTKIKTPPLAQAEIETHAPYQPFHTDRRITLAVYSAKPDRPSETGSWVFGCDIPTRKVIVRSVARSDDGSGPDTEGKAKHHEMENLISLGQGGTGEHVVITTRRKRGHDASGEPADEDGFFEDDCDVLDFARDRV